MPDIESDTEIQIDADGVLKMNTSDALTSNQVEVTNLTFYNLSYPKTNPRTQNIRIELTIKYKNPSNLTAFKAEQTLETTVELRGK